MPLAANGDFDASNRVVFTNHDNGASTIESYQWDISSPRELSLCRKLSDVVSEVESTLTVNDIQREPMSFPDVVCFIHDASVTVKRCMAEYGDFLWNEEQRLEQQFNHDRDPAISRALQELKATTAILVNCEYVWSVAEIFWIDAADTNHSIRTTLRFLDVMEKFRTPSSSSSSCSQFDSDAYWRGLYSHAIHGKLDMVAHELKLNANLSAHSKQLMTDVCDTCPLVRCLLHSDGDDDDDEDDDDDTVLPAKADILAWKADVKRTCAEITQRDQHRLLPLLHVLLGNTDVIREHCPQPEDWLDVLCAYLLYHTPWLDHKRELRALVSMLQASPCKRGSIEWMFACIMSREYEAILNYVSTPSFPRWFAPHLCYFLRQIEGDRVTGMQWPRAHDLKLFVDGDANVVHEDVFNAYLSAHPKMTVLEWIFESYVEALLLVTDDAWLWLKNYLYFFKRRGSAMLTAVFEHAAIDSDRVAYRMLQCCDELGLDDAVYNSVCLRMAQQSYARGGGGALAMQQQYGRIAYWCCKCRGSREEDIHSVCLSKYVRALLERYLDDPSKHINTLHDVYDNAAIHNTGDGEDQIASRNRMLQLLSKLRDMYLCRLDLQKLQIEYEQRQQRKQQQQMQNTASMIKTKTTTSTATPHTRIRGHLIDALRQPTDAHNKNLKHLANSFEVVEATTVAATMATPNYPSLKGRIGGVQSVARPKMDCEQSPSSSSSISSSPFPQKIIASHIKKPTNDFLLQHLTTPPRPTPSRHRKSHRKSARTTKSPRQSSKRKRNYKKRKMQSEDDEDDDDEDDDDEWSVNGDEDGDDTTMMGEDDKNYMFECCDIIVSYVEYLVEILCTDIYDVSQLVRILMFSLPMFMHCYSPNAIRLEQVLLIAHKWYSVKFMKNRKLSGMQQFDAEHELKFIQHTLSHLQSKVLATTYANKNYAEIWHKQQQAGVQPDEKNDMDQDDDDKEDQDSGDDDDDLNVIDID